MEFLLLWESLEKNKKILFFKDHINNLMKSIRIYRLDRKNLKKKIISLININ